MGWKTRENVVILDFLAVDNFDFKRKIKKKKTWVKNSWKCWNFVKIEFLDKNLTFRIVCAHLKSRSFAFKNGKLWVILHSNWKQDNKEHSFIFLQL